MLGEGRKYMPVYYHGKSLRYPIRENLYGLYENKENICSSRKIILFEAEKSVMMLDSFYNGQGNGVALSGMSYQGIFNTIQYMQDTQGRVFENKYGIGLDKELPLKATPLPCPL